MNKKNKLLQIIIILCICIAAGVLNNYGNALANEENKYGKEQNEYENSDYIDGEVIIALIKSDKILKKGETVGAEKIIDKLSLDNAIEKIEYVTHINSDVVSDSRLKKAKKGLDFYKGFISEDQSVESVVKILNESGDVYFAEPNYICRSSGARQNIQVTKTLKTANVIRDIYCTENIKKALQSSLEPWNNDELISNQWYIENINAIDAWKNIENTGKTAGEGVTVAVVDTGISLANDDLIANVKINEGEYNKNEGIDDDSNGYVDDIYGVNMANIHNNMTDSCGHGTLMAGIIAMTAGNGGGIGIAYGSKIMPVKVGIDQNFGTDVAVEGIKYALKNGADIINMSFGTYNNSLLLREAIKEAAQSCMLVAAAGNEGFFSVDDNSSTGTEKNMYPAAYENVVGVMAYDKNENMCSFSNKNADESAIKYEIAAPGVEMYSTSLRNSHKYTEGTSPATAVCAGAMAVFRGIFADRKKYTAMQLQKSFLEAMKHNVTYLSEKGQTMTTKKVYLPDIFDIKIDDTTIGQGENNNTSDDINNTDNTGTDDIENKTDTGNTDKTAPVQTKQVNIKKIKIKLKKKYGKKRNKAVLSWKTDKKCNISGYYVYSSSKPKSSFTLIKKTKAKKMTVRCKKRKIYYYVKAYVKKNKKIYFSKKSEVRVCFKI